MKRKKKSASRRRGEILPIDSYSLMGDPDFQIARSRWVTGRDGFDRSTTEQNEITTDSKQRLIQN